MHRAPVGEFVDAMDRGQVRPHPRTVRRLELDKGRHGQGDRHAEKTGKQKRGALSFLAEMLEPIWPGYVTSSGDERKAWLTASQMPNFAWSSQGRGFFTDRAGRDSGRTGAGLVLDKNFRRRDCAIELAEKLGMISSDWTEARTGIWAEHPTRLCRSASVTAPIGRLMRLQTSIQGKVI